MLSKRDLQLVRLAVRWKWISPEQGEDLLFLKRKFGGKLTVEEIIRRRGYIADQEIDQLAQAANQLVGRGRPAPKVKPAPRRASGARLDPATTTARGAAPVVDTPAPPSSAPAQPMTRIAPAATASKRPAIAPQRAPIEAPSTRLTLIDQDPDKNEQPLPPKARRVLPPDRAATVLMQSPFAEDAEPARPAPPSKKSERPTEWMARAYVPSHDRDTDPPLNASDVSDELSALAPATIVTALPQHVLEALQRDDGPEEERTAVASEAQVEMLRRFREEHRAPMPEIEDVPYEPVRPVDPDPYPEERVARPRVEVREVREPRGRRPTEQRPVPVAPSVERAHRAPTIDEAHPIEGIESLEIREPRVEVRPSIARSVEPLQELEVQPVDLRFESVTGKSKVSPRPREPSSLFGQQSSLPGEPVQDLFRAAPISIAPREMLDEADSTIAPEDELGAGLEVVDDEDAGLLTGELGPYTIERVIARGSRGVLYKAHAVDGTAVALKVLAPEAMRSHTFLPRMYEAAEKAMRIDSPYVVRVIDAGNLEGHVFFAVELVDAWTLEERLDSGDRPGLLESLRIARDVARALDAAARAGVVHRDVNPDSILIGRGGEARLTGFALPKELTVGTAPLSAGEAPIYGTAGYLAPEQVLGNDADPRSDLYALGATLFHLVTGRRVFEGNDATAILAMVTREPAPKTRTIDPAVPEIAAEIVDKLLSLHRDDRFADAAQLIAAFDVAISKLEISEAEGARVAQTTHRRQMVLRTAGLSSAILSSAFLLPLLAVKLELVPWSASRFLLHDALAGAGAVIFALVLLTALALVRRGELPLPMSSAWLVRLQDGAGAVGAALLAGAMSVSPGAVLNVMVSLIAAVVLASWIYGMLLRRTIAMMRPDRGVGRMLAVLGDPSLARWRLVHVPLLATLALLATARWAFLAYFAASAGV